MKVVLRPILDTPALLIKTGNERALVVADLHLGIEGELARKGISLPSQTPKTLHRLLNLLRKYKPDRLIFLGDVKHNVPVPSWQEWRELPEFFEKLSKHAQVEVVPGNHDGDLSGMLPKGVVFHSAQGITVGHRDQIGLAHGHAWPGKNLFRAKTLVLAHNHPAVEFRDALGGRIIEPVWLKLQVDPIKLPSKLRAEIERKPPGLLLMPAFGELVSGAPVNRPIPKELIGALFRSGAANIESAHAYMLDGTYIGKVKTLKKLFGVHRPKTVREE